MTLASLGYASGETKLADVKEVFFLNRKMLQGYPPGRPTEKTQRGGGAKMT